MRASVVAADVWEDVSEEAEEAASEGGRAASESGVAAGVGQSAERAREVLEQSALAHTGRVLEREVLKEVIEEDARRWSGCLMLPVTLLFFASYSAAASLHVDVASGHLMESPIRAALVPPLDEEQEPDATMLQGVATIPDAYRYMNETFLPLFFRQTDSFGGPLPRGDWGTVFGYSRVVGMVIMELTRSVKRDCTLEHATHMYCYPQDEPTGEAFGRDLADLPGGSDYYLGGDDPIVHCEGEGFTTSPCLSQERRLEIARQELQRKMPAAAADEAMKYRFFLDGNSTFKRVAERLGYLRSRGWLDEQSMRLTLRVSFLNEQLAAPRLEQCEITFMFSRGGGVFSTIRMESLVLQMYSSTASYLFDALFCLLLCASTCYMVAELTAACRARLVRQHFNVVNVITWLTCFFGWFNVCGLVVTNVWRQELLLQLEEYEAGPSHAAALRLQDSVDAMLFYVDALRLFVADAHLLFMARCFVSLQWQPRLAVVTQTLAATSVDLFHFMIVLVLTFFAFAISGMMMFGRRLEDFATPVSAISTCFKIAMESEFKWREISSQDFWTSATWVWIYLLLVVLLMLNMVLAIIMDVYQEVRQHSGESITLWGNVVYIYRFLRHRKQWMSTEELLELAAELPRMVTMEELRSAFRGMSEYQLEHLVAACANRAQVVSRVGVHSGHVAQMVSAIHLSLEQVLLDVDALKARGFLGKGLEVRDESERECVKDILTSVAMQGHWMGLMQKNLEGLQAEILNDPGALSGPSSRSSSKRQGHRRPSRDPLTLPLPTGGPRLRPAAPSK